MFYIDTRIKFSLFSIFKTSGFTPFQRLQIIIAESHNINL